MRRLVFVLVLALLPIGCASGPRPTPDQARVQARLKESRAYATKRGRDYDIHDHVQRLTLAQRDPDRKAAYGPLDWPTLNAEAEALLEKYATMPGIDELEVLDLKGPFLAAIGRVDEAIALYDDLYERSPTIESVWARMAFHKESGVPLGDPAGFCEANRSLVSDDDERIVYLYLDTCVKLNPSDSPETSLPWASESDLEIYARFQEQIAEQERERLELVRQEDEQAAREAAMAEAEGSDAGSGSAAASSVNVTLRNTCPSSVDLFFGEKPGFGSGKYTSLSSNTTQNMSFRPGDMIWIVDDSQNGISSTTVSGSTRTVEVGSGCTSLTSK